MIEWLNRRTSEELLVAYTISAQNKRQALMRVLNPINKSTCVRQLLAHA